MTRPRRWLSEHPYAGVLTNRSLRRLYLGLFLSSIGDGIAVVSVPWLALEIAGSVNRALAVAAAGGAAFLPGIPVSLIAGGVSVAAASCWSTPSFGAVPSPSPGRSH